VYNIPYVHILRFFPGYTSRNIIVVKKGCISRELVVTHTYNPNYSGGRDYEDHALRPALTKI
jgi:hypothetical protein